MNKQDLIKGIEFLTQTYSREIKYLIEDIETNDDFGRTE